MFILSDLCVQWHENQVNKTINITPLTPLRFYVKSSIQHTLKLWNHKVAIYYTVKYLHIFVYLLISFNWCYYFVTFNISIFFITVFMKLFALKPNCKITLVFIMHKYFNFKRVLRCARILILLIPRTLFQPVFWTQCLDFFRVYALSWYLPPVKSLF
jgi:hypothetical protein